LLARRVKVRRTRVMMERPALAMAPRTSSANLKAGIVGGTVVCAVSCRVVCVCVCVCVGWCVCVMCHARKR
jgi:hypothetical protein